MNKNKLSIVLIVIHLTLTCGQVSFGQSQAGDGRQRQIEPNVQGKWERVFLAAGSRPFRTVYSAPLRLGKAADLSWLWAGDEDGFVWVTVIDPNSAATFLPKDEQSYFGFSKIAVDKSEGRNQKSPTQVKAILFLDRDNGYVLKGSKIYRTENAGFTWRLVYSVPDRPDKTQATLLSMAITPSKHACVVGMYSLPDEVKDSLVVCTAQPLGLGDPHWQLRQVESQVQLFHVFFVDDSDGWISGMEGTVLRTMDGGATWTPTTISTESLLQIYFRDHDNGWVVGRKGEIFRTVDGGTHWESVSLEFSAQLHDVSLRCIRFADSKTGWIVGDWGTILGTDDGGETWRLEQPPMRAEGDLNSLFVDDTFCWAVGGLPQLENSPRKPTRTIWRLRWK